MPLKQVLLVTYYFPPLGGPGAIRPAKFCRYLPEFDWSTTALTVKDIAYYTHDRYLLEDVALSKIVASGSLDPARILYRLGKKSVKWTGSPSALAGILNLPDSKLGWLMPAVLKGLPLARSAQVILATAPPFTSLLVGLLLSRLTGRPLVADFRDSWLEFPFVPYTGIYQHINYWLEREVARHAAHILAVSRAIEGDLCRRYPWLKDNMTVIPNGFDPSDFDRPSSTSRFT
jgi:glycosyltransferase involved in cell wall biosynthesis